MSAPVRRRAAGRATPRAPLRLLFAGLAALLTTPLLAAPTAHAAGVPLGVTITSVTVDGGDATSPVVVKGTVANRSTAPVYGVTAGLWRSSDQLRTVTAITDALAADRTPTGAVQHELPSETATLTPPTDALAPGASLAFSVSATVADLALTQDASYWIGARVTGSAAPRGVTSTSLTGQGQTLATIPGTTPVRVTTVIDLTSTPRRVRPGLFTDDGLAADLATGGRLQRLLDAAAQPGLSWAIDPALLAEVTDMADGYDVGTPQASTPGTGVAAAKAWLVAYRALPTASGVQSLYGHPDLVGALDSGSTAVLDRAQQATAEAKLDLPVVDIAARISEAGLTALASRGVPVVSPAAGADHPWTTMAGASVAGATTLDAAVASPLLGDTPATRAAVATALARASGGQVRLIESPDAAAVDALTPAWAVRTPLPTWLAGAPTGTAGVPTAAAASGALTAPLLGRLTALRAGLTTYGAVAPTSPLAPLADALVAGAAGEAFLGDAAARTAYLDALASATAVTGRITLSATRDVTLASSESQFPATITNHLSDPITVKVVGQSGNSARMRIAPTDQVTIRPGDSQTVLVSASASGNGLVLADLYVATADGVRVSDAVPISVEATNLGQIGWVVVVASAVVLVVTTGLRIRQVRRRTDPGGRGGR